MAVATARVVVLMTPQEKAALDIKAASAGSLSVAELVRRAVDAYDIAEQHEADELARTLELFGHTRAETHHQLDATDRKLDEALAALKRLDA